MSAAPEPHAPRAPWPRFALAAAVLLRLVVGIHLWVADPLTRAPVSDAAYYDAWARALAAGEAFGGGLPHWMPPLYPWLLGALYRVVGPSVGAAVALQLVVGVANTFLLVALARRVLTPRAVHVAAWLWVLYAPLVLFEARLLAVNAALPACLGALLLGVVAIERVGRGDRATAAAFGAGLCAGLAALARPNLLLGPVGFVVGAWFDLRRARRDGARPRGALLATCVAVLGAALPLGAGLASNVARSGEPVLVSANGGVNFWFGWNDRARGTFAAPSVEWGDIGAQRDVARAATARALGVPVEQVDDGAASRHFYSEGFAWIASHPGNAATLALRKLAANLSSTEYGIQVVPAAVRESAPSLWLAPLPFGLVLALAVLSRGRGVAASGALLGWIGAAQVAAVLFFTYSRFRLPWYPALVLFAAAGLVELARREHVTRARVAAWIVAASLLALSFVDTERGYARALRANALVDTSLAWERLGEDERRLAPLERALELVPGDAKALDELGRLEWQRGDERAAKGTLERALATGVDYPQARRRLALLLTQSRDPEVADRDRGEALLRDWLATRSASDFGALELGLALAESLDRRATFDDEARAELVRLVRWLADANAGDPRLESLTARYGA
ncbi:MAG: glycosyltransferase family 39 protein [Planctomycetota bacterium]